MTPVHALGASLAAITISSPTGPAWEFLTLFLVVIIGPPLLERARLPGIIGLLVGGYVIGPFGLGLIGAGNTTVPELGQVGLLYLMFIAGVELDLALLRVHRRAVVTFGLITFAMPMLFGTVVGVSLSWSAPSALLLGSLMASHTLLVYPTVRRAGLSRHPAVATAVGATVLTDTATLVVLASVSGSQLVGGSPATIGLQIAFGLVVLMLFSLVVLPRLVRLGFRYLGTDRIVRYLLAIASFLAAATVAGSLGIEGLVGAFFAGLGLNRLVPNEGPLMERIDFFGSAVFVPIFLVSVGMLLQPSVMIEPQTLKLAGLFIVATLGGKAVAAAAAKKLLGLSIPEATLMLGLTVPQAAATLAATVIGFNIGLFDQSVVNAVLVLILVSIIAGTLITERARRLVEVPHAERPPLGTRVLVALEDSQQSQLSFTIAARVAGPDSGVIRAMLGSPPAEARAREASLTELHRAGFALGVDVDPRLLVGRSLAEGIVNAVAVHDPSLVLVGQRSASAHPLLGSSGEAVAASVLSPVAILIGEMSQIAEVLLIEDRAGPGGLGHDGGGVAAELASRIDGRHVVARAAEDAPAFHDLVPGQLCVVAGDSLRVMAACDPPPGAALILVLGDPRRPSPVGLDLAEFGSDEVSSDPMEA